MKAMKGMVGKNVYGSFLESFELFTVVRFKSSTLQLINPILKKLIDRLHILPYFFL